MEIILTADVMEKLQAARTINVDGIELEHYGIRDIKDVSNLDITHDTYLVLLWNGTGFPFTCAEEQIKNFIKSNFNYNENE